MKKSVTQDPVKRISGNIFGCLKIGFSVERQRGGGEKAQRIVLIIFLPDNLSPSRAIITFASSGA
ncbi:MAG: hypothetical protein C0433_07405 [Cyclobacterium sp.]|nr:hypothetical protein [Cyclobacterium sp.]